MNPKIRFGYAWKFSSGSGSADIITPTAQNLTNIEEDANQLLVDTKGKPTAERKKLLDMLLRAYDPCLSCAAH